MGAAMSTTIHSTSVVIAAIAQRIAELLVAGPVPRDAYLQQLRRSIASAKAMPIHMMLAVSFEDADNIEVPLGQITEPYLQLVCAIEQRRRMKLEGVTGSTHAIAGPSLLREIKRENRAEYVDATAEDEVLDNEDDVDAIERLLSASAVKRHELDRRDARARERLAALRLRLAMAG